MANEYYAKDKQSAVRTEQRRHADLMKDSIARNLTVYIYDDVPNEWKTAVEEAMAARNQKGSKIKISRVYSRNPTAWNNRSILVYNDENYSSTIASSYWPYNGFDGPFIAINKNYNGRLGLAVQSSLT